MLRRRSHIAFVLAGILALVVRCAPLHAQPNAVRIEFTGQPERSTVAGAFHRGGTLYVSLSDMTHIFALNTYENREARKLEIKRAGLRIKVAGGNPFVIVTDESGRQSVYQLPQDVLFAAGSFFVPLTSFLPLVPLTFGLQGFFSPADTLLHFGGEASASLFDIPSVALEPKANGLLIRIAATKKLADYENWLRADGWLYVTIANARADTASINAMKTVAPVREIIAIQSPTSAQLTFRLAGRIASSEIVPDEASNDLLVLVRAAAPEELAPQREKTVQPDLEGSRKRWELDVIVLDAGHGGYDPGTIGVTGVREKTIALGIVLKLGKLIERNLRGVKVVYTRKDDRFVELDKRGKIANEAGGKLFISVHANSRPRKPSSTRGFEVYLLRPGRTEEAIAIAERENSVIQLEEGYQERYQELTEENFILVAMAQSAHVKASELFADLTQREMASRTGIPNRGVKQAGFYVLVGAAMPNILVEAAYLSNREDERFLKSDAGQQKVAESLFRAVKKYKEEYEKLLQEGSDLGAK
ncbi:MAG: N-acetylmuramoyl-L-alanine amidase [Bacteroidota bacterium]